MKTRPVDAAIDVTAALEGYILASEGEQRTVDARMARDVQGFLHTVLVLGEVDALLGRHEEQPRFG